MMKEYPDFDYEMHVNHPVWDSVHLETTLKDVLKRGEWRSYNYNHLNLFVENLHKLLPYYPYSTIEQEEYQSMLQLLKQKEIHHKELKEKYESSFNYIIGKAMIDNNYLVSYTAKEILKQS